MPQRLLRPHRFWRYGHPNWPRCLSGQLCTTSDGPSLTGASPPWPPTTEAPLEVRWCCHFVTALVGRPRASLTRAKRDWPHAPMWLARCVLCAGGAVATLMVPQDTPREGTEMCVRATYPSFFKILDQSCASQTTLTSLVNKPVSMSNLAKALPPPLIAPHSLVMQEIDQDTAGGDSVLPCEEESDRTNVARTDSLLQSLLNEMRDKSPISQAKIQGLCDGLDAKITKLTERLGPMEFSIGALQAEVELNSHEVQGLKRSEKDLR
ncbi:hypothetical protein NDU88_008139 [Pleurodeles waltl]|uniref:Uncharacterized protein n=1 Tax=Pleurodeles waltl TaxID=8319 RepID=A0AAV7NVM0_PLEWA|nr:hypothetical protein NDU88_008139 [Pleurodeles waltl]